MKHNFKLEFNPQIYTDIQSHVDFYYKKTKSHKLGKRYTKTVETEIKSLKTDALLYEIKYDDIRCLPIPNFPVRAHYRIDKKNNIVKIEAIIGTAQGPDKWIKS